VVAAHWKLIDRSFELSPGRTKDLYIPSEREPTSATSTRWSAGSADGKGRRTEIRCQRTDDRCRRREDRALQPGTGNQEPYLPDFSIVEKYLERRSSTSAKSPRW